MTSDKSINPKFAVDAKYKGLDTNVWIELNQLNDESEFMVNLGQGFPDYNPAPDIVKELAKVCEPNANPAFHQYARAYGHPRLVKALATLYGRLIGVSINPMTEVLVTGGAYGALFYSILSNVGKNDEVIIIEPYFDCYEPMVLLAGGTPIYISLERTPSGGKTGVSSSDEVEESSESWCLDMKHLASLFNQRTKAIILNTPNNPLGKVFSRQELSEIAELCKKFNVLVISDEVYEWIIYKGQEHVRMASLEGMWDRTITICSAGKTFSLTGWKLGWCYGPEKLMRNLQIAHQNCTYMCQTPEQEAVAATMEKEIELLGTSSSFFHQLVTTLTEKRDRLVQIVKDVGMIPIIPQGGYFLMCDWSPLESGVDLNSEDGCTDFRFVKWLAKKKQLLGIPPSAFYSPEHKHLARNYIRFNFYKREETFQKAQEILRSWKMSNEGK